MLTIISSKNALINLIISSFLFVMFKKLRFYSIMDFKFNSILEN